MEGNEQLAIIVPMLQSVGAGIAPEQFAGATPCATFTVADVMDHMTTLASAFAPAFRGDPPRGDAAPLTAEDRAPRFHAAMGDLLDAVNSPGALDRTVETPFGPMPGGVFSRLVAFDGLIHGWDLASSTGQSWDPPADVVAEIDGFARQAITADLRDGDTFADEVPVPEGATPLQRLVAFSGRAVPE